MSTYRFHFGLLHVFLRDERGQEFKVPRSYWDLYRAERKAAGDKFHPEGTQAQLVPRVHLSAGPPEPPGRPPQEFAGKFF